ncbi:hypothetical protein HPP92_012833 [Vanilla planifolia]|uniref:Metalloenzyme domain-containing protein n=1 Tax=Vanilla planifolia TaxID=51239 RepID=A0A835QSW8_VANPL|nr:hypothetical protein HPP92_012833 [Vanilla planifolia]
MDTQKNINRRVAFVLIDGIGDVSLPRFHYQTPLQIANIPTLDAIASAGVNGLMDPVEPGLACGSDTAHLSLLGYDPRIYYRGRGAFESMGAGLAMSPGDIAFKGADRHFEEEGPILSAALDGMKLPSYPEYEVRVRYATEHRCAEALDDTAEAKHTAAVVNELSREISRILSPHPINVKRAAEGKNIANVVLLRGCGIRIEVNPFEKKHGLLPCMVAPTKIIAGLGLSLGIDILEAPGATGDYRTLLTSKATAIAKALSAPLQPCPSVFVPGQDAHKPGPADGYDFGFLHIKAVDDAGHDKASTLKVRALEAVDRAIAQLIKLLWQAEKYGKFEYYVCVTGDHSTPVEYGDHSFESVPFALCKIRDFVGARGESTVMCTPLDTFTLPSVVAGEDICDGITMPEKSGEIFKNAFAGDSVSEFNEIAAAGGCLGRFPGSEMMGIIKKFIKLKNE